MAAGFEADEAGARDSSGGPFGRLIGDHRIESLGEGFHACVHANRDSLPSEPGRAMTK